MITLSLTDLKDHADTLSSELDLTSVHQQRLHNLLCPHIRDSSVAHIDATSEIAKVVAVAELGHHADRVNTSVLSQSIGDNLQCLRLIKVLFN